IDVLGYCIRGQQFFENTAVLPASYSEAYRAQAPTDIHILSAKIDNVKRLRNLTLETGWKSSTITTDNASEYEYRDGNNWMPDLKKSNHFQYHETIHAAYGSVQTSFQKWSLQGGLRFEQTTYQANQLGNTAVKDSSFSRRYQNLFPTLAASFRLDSTSLFSVSAGRRIDRPAFQKLNPFITIYNKYSYQRGNPYYRPQYTWNFGLNHTYKNMLVTGMQYSVTTDYFSQLFVTDSTGLVLFTEGNLRRMQNLGASVSLQLAPLNEWSFSLQGFVNRKKLEGTVGRSLVANITQYAFTWNNQFHLKKGWTAELNSTYNSTSQQDIQEVLDPTGSMSVGLAKTLAREKGRVR
ncbi:MAG TPA: outer membrane beta-barrel family protein, partial [Flavisolibacter sp.]|nr:outer membrane beta-barrel family protein [Flavisolibacter sp.]